MTSKKNSKISQRRNGVQKTKKVKDHKSNMQQTKLIQEVKELNQSIKEMTMRLDAFLVKEEEPTKEELRAIRIGKREIAEGKLVSWEEVKKKLK